MKVGFVGLEPMEASMAASLLKAGQTVDHRTRTKVDALVAEGAKDAVITKKLDFLICQDARQEAGGTIALTGSSLDARSFYDRRPNSQSRFHSPSYM